jgi:hypothetical protein
LIEAEEGDLELEVEIADASTGATARTDATRRGDA